MLIKNPLPRSDPRQEPAAREAAAALLAEAQELVRSDPGQARRLAARCIELAGQAAAPELAAGAHYLSARALAANAEYEAAVAHIVCARQGYLAAGASFDALRTNVGLMTVLYEQGRYQEALDAGQHTLAELATLGGDVDEEDGRHLTALVKQNAGACYGETACYDAALAAYAEAEAGFRTLDMPQQIGDVANNRGVVLLGLGRPTEALATFERSAALFEAAGLTSSHAVTLLNIGNAYLLQGQFGRSLEAFEAARRRFAAIDARAGATVLTLDTGDAYMALNRYPEALAAYAAAGADLREAGMPRDQARALWGAGAALIALGRLDEAAGALDEAATIFSALENQQLLSGVLLEHAALQARRGDRPAARVLAARALALVEGAGWPVQRCYAHLRLADLHDDDQLAVEAHLLAAQLLVAQLAIPHLDFRLRQRLGRLRLRQGRADEAFAMLSGAAELIERLRGNLATESLRVSFLQDKVAVYDDLLQLQLARPGRPWAALALAERARALIDRLAAGGPAAPGATSPAQAELAADLNAAYTELLGHGGEPLAPARAQALRARAGELEQALALAHLRAAAAAGPDPLAPALEADALRDLLRGGPGLLAYHLLGDEILAFVAVDGELHVARGISGARRVEPLIARLASQLDRFSAGPAFVARHLPILEQSARQILRELYAELVAPLAHLLAAIQGEPRPLVVVPHALLHQVPFHALHDGERYLLDAFELSYAPSVTALTLGGGARPPAAPPLIVGVPDPSIPLVEDEVRAIAGLLPGATVLLGERASRDAVCAQAPGSAVIHLACHGRFRADNPSFSALRLGDGWLTAAEIARLDLRGALVSLSACESGRGRVYDGDEVIGLTRAFLGAGARTLLVSLWLAQDTTTAALMRSWYNGLIAGLEPAAALRIAQIAVRERAPHPYYWAPFFLVGDRSPARDVPSRQPSA